MAGMTLEETHEEDDVEAADEDNDPIPPTPHAPRRGPVGRLSGDMKEHQLQAAAGAGKRNIHGNPAECVRLTKSVKTPDISATHAKSPFIKEIISQGTTPG
jgi:hypothetical protein